MSISWFVHPTSPIRQDGEGQGRRDEGRVRRALLVRTGAGRLQPLSVARFQRSAFISLLACAHKTSINPVDPVCHSSAESQSPESVTPSATPPSPEFHCLGFRSLFRRIFCTSPQGYRDSYYEDCRCNHTIMGSFGVI